MVGEFKIVNADTHQVVHESVEWYEGLALLKGHKNYCIMRMNDDVEDRLARRSKLISVSKSVKG